MGDNQVELVEGYLKLKEELEFAKKQENSQKVEVLNAKIEGVIFSYETYTTLKFDNLMEDWKWYNRENY